VSLVEKALEKLRAGDQGDGKDARARAPREATAPPVERLPAVRETFTPEQARRTIKIDERALRAAKVLAAEDEVRRAGDEFRAIKREIIDSAFKEGGAGTFERRLVVMTSALPGDGKTQTSVNLALSIAQERDSSVVLIDGDVAKPHVSQLFGLSDEPGLLDLLSSPDKDVRSVLLATNRPNLWILPAGRRSEIATELLASQRMREVCEQIAALLPQAVLLLDSPPLLVTSEAGVLASIAGQVVVVVKAGETPRQAVIDAISRIDDQDRLKMVLNQTHARGAGSYYYGNWLAPGAQAHNDEPVPFGSSHRRE